MTLREKIRRIRLLRNVYGFFRFLQFRHQLKLANREFANSEQGKANDGIPLPPPMLRYRVHRALDASSFVEIGRETSDDLVSVLKATDKKPGEFSSVLDFACGCGRVLRHLHLHLTGASIRASDIDSEAIGWCQKNLSNIADFSLNDAMPPTQFDDNQFDLIYVVSLFTHLDEAAQFAWLNELKRILMPGGILVASIHGDSCTDACRPEELQTLKQTGFVYRIDHTGKLKLDGLPDTYQTTFHTREYVLDNWGKIMPVKNYLERGINNHQDAVIMTK